MSTSLQSILRDTVFRTLLSERRSNDLCVLKSIILAMFLGDRRDATIVFLLSHLHSNGLSVLKSMA
jgi:hypothetical protein